MSERDDFLRLLRRRRPPRAPRLPRPSHGEGVARRYARALHNGPVSLLAQALQRHLLPELRELGATTSRMDADDSKLRLLKRLLARVRGELKRRWTAAESRRLAQAIGGELDQVQAREGNAWLEQLVGVDVFGGEPWLAAEVRRFTRENVELITSITSQTLDRIEVKVREQISNGDRWEALADTLGQEVGISQRRATLIARDQAGKFYGALNETRMKGIGIDRYTWRTMRDNRVRDEHEERDGKVYEWASPPEGGHPGEEVLCRCYADPDIEHLMKKEGIA